MVILYDDRLLTRNEANIDIEDRAYQFGDGVYEVICVYHGQPFYLDEHLKRFEKSAAAIRLQLPYPTEKLAQLLRKLIEENQLEHGNLYLQISRGTAPRSHAFPKQSHPLVVAYPQPGARPIPELAHGVTAITDEDIRWLRCDIKSLNLLGAVLSKQKAIDHGCQEAILIREGIVTEGSSTNIFIVKEQTLWTHPANHLILHGITRKITLQLADELGISVKTVPFDKQSLLGADEVFMTSTTMEICPIVQIDGQPVQNGSPGPITRRLQEAFEQKIAMVLADKNSR
jgi:D-alanine transaminase